MLFTTEFSESKRLVDRQEALSRCAIFEEKPYKILKVEAQAGQGKTTLVRLFEKSSSRKFIWVACTAEDSDMRYLFGKVIAVLTEALPDVFTAESLLPLQQPLSFAEYMEIVPRLVAALLARCGLEITLVFDDTHLLQKFRSSKEIVRFFVDVSPDDVKFIFISRFAVTIDEKSLFSIEESVTIDRDILAFSREEVACLYNEKLGVPVDVRRVNQLLEATGGWVTGLILLSSSKDIRQLKNASESGDLGQYFKKLIGSSVSDRNLGGVTLLSLLPDISDKILESCSSVESEWFEMMAASDLFVSVGKNADGKSYILHHLLQAYLNSKVTEKYTELEICDFMKRAGSSYIESGMVIKGLSCHIRARAWAEIEKVMQQYCNELLARHQHQTVLNCIYEVPEEVKLQSPWICFACGAAQLELDPAACSPNLNQALQLFRESNDGLGELVSACLLINFHVLFSGEFGNKKRLIDRASYLLEKMHEQLPPAVVAGCAQAVVVGLTYCKADISAAGSFLEMMINANLNAGGFKNDPWQKIPAILVKGFRGEIRSGLEKLNPQFVQLRDSLISPSRRFGILISYLNFLMMYGDFAAYEELKVVLQKDWEPYLQNSHLGKFIIIWDLDIMICRGEYLEALDHIDLNRKETEAAGAHIYSQLLHYETLALAHLGRCEEMKRSMHQSLRLRAKSGGKYFLNLNHLLVAAALSLVGEEKTAERIFNSAMRWQEDNILLYHTPIAYSYRALMYLDSKKPDLAKPEVEKLLLHMKERGNVHFFGWSSVVMHRVLCFAVQNGIEEAYALKLGRERMDIDIYQDGSTIPLLHIKTIGKFELKVGKARISHVELSSMQRSLLGHLATSPDFSRSVESCKLAIWPEGDSGGSKSKFDTMLSRLRSKLKSVFGNEAALYFQRKGQHLYLKHCVIDCDLFIQYGDRGADMLQRNRFWQADTAFSSMNSLLPSGSGKLNMESFPDSYLAIAAVRYLSDWGRVLKLGKDLDKALGVIEKGLAIEPINDELQRQRYNLLIALNRPGEAMASVKAYRESLAAEGFQLIEINKTIDTLLAKD